MDLIYLSSKDKVGSTEMHFTVFSKLEESHISLLSDDLILGLNMDGNSSRTIIFILLRVP